MLPPEAGAADGGGGAGLGAGGLGAGVEGLGAGGFEGEGLGGLAVSGLTDSTVAIGVEVWREGGVDAETGGLVAISVKAGAAGVMGLDATAALVGTARGDGETEAVVCAGSGTSSLGGSAAGFTA